MKAATLLLVSSVILLASCSGCVKRQKSSLNVEKIELEIDWQGEDIYKIIEPDPIPLDKLKLSTCPETENIVTTDDEYEENWCAV